MDFDTLPVEIKQHIFSYLSFNDLYFKVSNVSKHWQTLTHDSYLVKHIDIDEQFDAKEIAHCLTKYNFAPSLTMSNIESYTWIYEIPVNNNLRRLRFNNCYFEHTALPLLSTRFPMISSLILSDCRYSFSGLPFMTATNESVFIEINTDCVRLFSENCHRLEEIVVNGFYSVNHPAVQTLLNLHSKSLKKMHILLVRFPGNYFTALSQCSQMVDLHLGLLTDVEDYHYLLIKKLRSLQTLSLHEVHNISENMITELFTKPAFPHLYSINIRCCSNLSDDALNSIAKSYPTLKSLAVSECRRITNAGVRSVVDNCSVLETLNLAYNRHITRDIVELIIRRLVCLKYLNIYHCEKVNFTKFDLLQLTKSKPKLYICNLVKPLWYKLISFY